MNHTDSFKITGIPILTQMLCFMDGGSVLLKLSDSNSRSFEVEFVQTMIQEKYDYTKYPGSILLNNNYVPVRSELERSIIEVVKSIDLSNFNQLDRTVIRERIEFIESDEYIKMAEKVGRID